MGKIKMAGEVPKVNEIDEAVFIIRETIKTLQLKLTELESKQTPYRGRVVKYPRREKGKA